MNAKDRTERNAQYRRRMIGRTKYACVVCASRGVYKLVYTDIPEFAVVGYMTNYGVVVSVFS